jgi:hypothetical protein
MTTTTGKATIRKIGNRFDYIRRYGVYLNGKRVDRVPGGLVQHQAQEMANDLNGVDIYADDEA